MSSTLTSCSLPSLMWSPVPCRLQRPGFAKLLERMEAGDTLVVTKLDRIGRDSIDVQKTVELCVAEDIRLIVLQLGNLDLTSSSGALMVKVLAAVADFERELIVLRTRAGQARARAEGKHMGRPLKTTETQRRSIRSRLKAGQIVSAVARDFKLSRATVFGIRSPGRCHFPSWREWSGCPSRSLAARESRERGAEGHQRRLGPAWRPQ